jgi:hypothetical protein
VWRRATRSQVECHLDGVVPQRRERFPVRVVDGGVGAQLLQPGVLSDTGDGDDFGTEMVRELHGQVTDPAASTSNQDSFTRLNGSGVSEGLPGGQRRHWKGCGFLVAD